MKAPSSVHFSLPASCLLLLLIACASQPLTVTREPVTLRLVAADTCGLLADELADAYEERHPWVTIEVEILNSAMAERTLRAGEADLALLSWIEKGASEAEEALWSQPFAQDGVVVIVHPATPFDEMGLAFLQEIYRGRVQEWGGMVLTVVSREDGCGTRAAFERVVLGERDVTLTAVVMSSNEAVLEYVARTPGAIGYVSTRRMGTTLEGVRVLPVEGILPTLAAVADGSYPLSRSLFLVTVGEPTGAARELAQWVLGPAGRRIVEG
jgi:phosphate transport system substrate-binding protein